MSDNVNAPAPRDKTWYDSLILASEANLRQQQGNVVALRKALREAQRKEAQIEGGLNTLRQLRELSVLEGTVT